MTTPASEPTGRPAARRESNREAFWRNVKSLLPALLIVLTIRSSIAEPFKIPSGSMIPTLLVGDYVFVNKLAYGIKVPFTDWFGAPTYLARFDGPKRGDVVVFLYPRDESVNFIKRVVGVPGDKIEVKDKVLYVNDKAFTQEQVDAKLIESTFAEIKDASYTSQRYSMRTEHLENQSGAKKDHSVLIDVGMDGTAFFGPVTVPPESYFCMGDNRDGSNDSRFWGFVPFRNIKGRAFVVWMSLWIDIEHSNFIVRPSRVGTLL